MKKNIQIKRARYIQKNIGINQEFKFAHPNTRFHLNTIYNSHFSGSSLWDVFSVQQGSGNAGEKLESKF